MRQRFLGATTRLRRPGEGEEILGHAFPHSRADRESSPSHFRRARSSVIASRHPSSSSTRVNVSYWPRAVEIWRCSKSAAILDIAAVALTPSGRQTVTLFGHGGAGDSLVASLPMWSSSAIAKGDRSGYV
jgi:hypothetical protein